MPIFLAPDAPVLLFVALAFDLAFGDMAAVFRFVPHPVVLVGRAITFFDNQLNRPSRSDAERLRRGIVTVAILVTAAALSGGVVKAYLRFVHYGWAIEALLVAVLLAQRSLFAQVGEVGKALHSGGLGAGRAAVARIVGRDPESLDEHGVVRAAIESLFENFSAGVLAPGFWYLLGGLPGIFAYKTANTLDSMIGHRSPKYLEFGWAASRFDDALNWIPARLAGILICVAALFVPRARAGAALGAMLSDAKKHRSPNAGWPEAAAAGALGLALGGPRRYGGAVQNEPWLGEGRARATLADLGMALSLYVGTAALLAALLLIAAAAIYLQ